MAQNSFRLYVIGKAANRNGAVGTREGFFLRFAAGKSPVGTR